MSGGSVEARSPRKLITIGQLAAYAGVTIKAIRHYHRRGLLEEPPRDASGYRRYGVEHAIQLVKIRTLADAGVPLARIKELLAADGAQFAAAIADVDRDLQARADALGRARERLARLGTGDRLFVSAEVADYLDRLRELGVSQRQIQRERDGWILLQAFSPEAAATWIAEKRDVIDDREFRDLYLEYDAAFEWSPTDPRLDALADRASRWMKRHRDTRADDGSRNDPAIAVLAASAGASSPAWDRLDEISRRLKSEVRS